MQRKLLHWGCYVCVFAFFPMMPIEPFQLICFIEIFDCQKKNQEKKTKWQNLLLLKINVLEDCHRQNAGMADTRIPITATSASVRKVIMELPAWQLVLLGHVSLHRDIAICFKIPL